MNMDSVFFIACFLPLSLAVYWLTPGIRAKNWVLLVLSVLYYSFAGLSGLLVLAVSCVFNYLLGLALRSGRGRKAAVVAGVTLNLGMLCLYKYLDFLLADVLGQPHMALELAAPLGISFFTFKCIAYLVDAYRDPAQATGNFGEFALYVTFFPQILMGPITRFSEFVPQLHSRSVTVAGAASGLRRFVAGLAKKLVIAAVLGAMTDRVFALDSGSLDIRLAWLGAVGYCLQLYFDFSGYVDMVIGLGTVFGFTTRENFCYPYTAVSIGDFWRRWHMSLSAWFKDYLYIPLGGNRKGALRTGVNKCIVFLLCGLWHGANWTFVLWGLWHGLLSLLESLRLIPVHRLAGSRGGRMLGRMYTLLAVCLGFVVFRAADVHQGFAMLGTMLAGFSFTHAATVTLHSLLTGEVLLALGLGVLLSMPVGPWLQKRTGLKKFLEPASYALSLVLLVLCMVKLAAGNFAPSIYAQF